MKEKNIETRNQEKLQKYFVTRDQKIREELVNDNQNLVITISLNYSKKLGLKLGEVVSYGYEGLLMAIENYDPNMNTSFSSYASSCIKGTILRGIPQLQGTKYNEFYRNFVKYKTKIEEIKGSRIKDDITVIDDILNKMIEDGLIDKKYFFYYKEQILLNNPLYFADMEEEIEDESNVYENINDENIKELVEKYLSILKPKQKIVLEYHFGLNGKPRKTLKEIAEIFGYTHEGVRLIEKRAIALLKRYTATYGIEYPEDIEDKNNGIKGRKLG